MDELIIGDKTYISSKRAAKITGYAKDYVGQLCREGRVEARLVGRNWYVLETSIQEHRFGLPETEEELVETEPEPAVVAEAVEDTWNAPVYHTEDIQMVPPLTVEEAPVASDTSRAVVSEMQNAWQEWFTSQKKPAQTLSDGNDDFDGSLTPMLQEEEPELEVHVTRVQEAQDPVFEDSEEEFLPIQRSYSTRVEEEVVHTDYPVMDLSQNVVRATHAQRETVSRKEDSNILVKALLMGVAFISVCIALVGTGAVQDYFGKEDDSASTSGGLIQFLGGEVIYKKSK